MELENHSISNRIKWIDYAKGIGILFVILGHTFSIPQWLEISIYSFHMPLFFVLSGLTVKTKDKLTRNDVFHLVKAYLLPYFLISFINLICWSCWQFYLHEFTFKLFLKYICGIVYCYATLDYMPNCSPLWFLPAIFITKLLFYLITSYINKKYQWIFVVISAIVAYIASILNCPRLPWGLLPALMGLLFFYIGYVCKDFIIQNEKILIKIMICVLGVISICFEVYYAENPSMSFNVYGKNILLFIVGAFGGSLIILEFSKLLSKLKIMPMVWCQNTLVILGFNYFARTFSTEFYYLLPKISNYPLTWPVSFILTTIVLLLIVFGYSFLKSKITIRKIIS